MKYIVIELQTAADGTVANLVSAYDDRYQAEQKYHLILSAAAVSTLPIHAAALLLSDGSIIAHTAYRHGVINNETELEP